MGSSREQNIKDLKKFREGKKSIGTYISEELHRQFTEKLEKDNLTKSDVLTTAVYQYINGELRVNKNK